MKSDIIYHTSAKKPCWISVIFLLVLKAVGPALAPDWVNDLATTEFSSLMSSAIRQYTINF
jgi:hypothetical protein